MFEQLGSWDRSQPTRSAREINWTNWRPITVGLEALPKRPLQLLDFETSHAL